jgi:predicted DNA-binding protein
MSKNKIKQNENTLNFRITEDMHERLRKCSYENRKAIAEICREGIETILKKYEKDKK